MGKMFKEEKSVGGTVKRLMVCSLCGPATIWSDALFHANHIGQSIPFKPTILLKKRKSTEELFYINNRIIKAEKDC